MKIHLQKTKGFNKAGIIFLSLMSLSILSKAQTTPAWVQFGGPADYANYDVREVSVGVDSIGNVYTAASAYDTIHHSTKTALIKYNSAGVQQWASLFDNANLASNDKDVVALLVDKSGNSYLCGYAYTNGATTSKDYMLAKYNNAGVQQWVKTYDGGQNNWDYITCATFDAAGNIIVGGYVNNNGGTTGDDIGIVKYGTSGTQLWTYQYNNAGSNAEDRCYAIASDLNNNIYITGSSYVTNGRNMLTMKLNSSGVNQWTKILSHANSSNDERGFSIVADVFGNCYVSGNTGDWLTMKYDPTGTVLWTNHHSANSLNAESLQKVLLDQNGDVIIASDAYNSGSDLSVSKLNSATGVQLWNATKSFGGTNKFSDAVLDNNGNVYVGGYYDGPLTRDISATIISSSGINLFSATYSNPTLLSGVDLCYHVAVDKSHNFYLAGLSERRGTGSQEAVDFVTLKYNALITGIKETSLNYADIRIYPNPAKEYFTLNFKEQSFSGAQVLLMNNLGQIVKQEPLNASTQTFNTDNLPAGIYVIKVMNAETVATGKIIIE